MSDTNFTPGPWVVAKTDYNLNGSTICKLTRDIHVFIDGDVVEEPMNDAHLISAAPDMYKALEEMIESMESDFAPGYGSEWHIKAIRALGKAGGG